MKKALIVVDMQHDFIFGSLGSKHAQAIVDAVCRKIESFDGEIFYTRDTHEHATYMETTEGKGLPVIHCIKESAGWALDSRVEASLRAKYADDAAFSAHGVDKPCFGSPARAEKISEIAISDVELIGLCTDICVISNALCLKARLWETPIAVCKDCCAGVTPASHDNALAAMTMCQIDIH